MAVEDTDKRTDACRRDGWTAGRNAAAEKTTATETTAAGNAGPDREPVSFPELLTEYFGTDFSALIRAYTGKPCLGWEIAGLSRGLGQPTAQTAVCLYLRAELSDGAAEELCLRYELDMRWGRERITGPVITCGHPGDEDRCDEYLLPEMGERDYVRAAERLRNGCRSVNPMTVATGMGLRVRRAALAEKDTMGMICFDRTEVALLREDGRTERVTFPPGTVLLNPGLCRTPEREAETLLHECAHCHLALPYYFVQRLSGRVIQEYCARTLATARADGPVARMERQAETLPGYVMMEETETRRKIEAQLARTGGDRSPENIRRALEFVVRRFGVTVSMARRRMMELGYPEAEGVLRRAEGRPVPDYGCSGVWTPGLRYTLSFAEAARLAASSEEIRTRLLSGEYLYAEGHLCRSSPGWLVQGPDGLRKLTPYARSHVDLCCIGFTVEQRPRQTDYPVLPGEEAAARRRKPEEVTDRYLIPVLNEDAEGEARERENDRFAEEAVLWMEMKRMIASSATVKEAVGGILLRRGLSWMELALRIGVDRKTVVGWLTRQRISFQHMLCICVALRLRGDVGRALVDLAECRMRQTPAYDLYMMMLMSAPSLTVGRCNEILVRRGFPPLFCTDRQEP